MVHMWAGAPRRVEVRMIELVLERLRVPRRTWAIYLVVYICAGLIMNSIGKVAQIAEFKHWWQVGTCYGLYLVPASIWIRQKSFFDQYLFGLLVLALLELGGYAIGSSVAFDGNIIDAILGPRNFTLAMTVFFAVYLPLGNKAVEAVERTLFGVPLETTASAQGITS